MTTAGRSSAPAISTRILIRRLALEITSPPQMDNNLTIGVVHIVE
jgi:hypothetical protein